MDAHDAQSFHRAKFWVVKACNKLHSTTIISAQLETDDDHYLYPRAGEPSLR